MCTTQVKGKMKGGKEMEGSSRQYDTVQTTKESAVSVMARNMDSPLGNYPGHMWGFTNYWAHILAPYSGTLHVWSGSGALFCVLQEKLMIT